MLTFSYLLVLLMAIVVYLDVTQFRIPNWLVGLLLALYPFYVLASPLPIDWPIGLAFMGGAFAIGYLIFAFNLMGGGDVKLFIVASLWASQHAMVEFLVLTTLVGGLLAGSLVAARPLLGAAWMRAFPNGTLPRILVAGEMMPYGLGISAGFIYVVITGLIPALPVLVRPFL